MDVHVHEEVHGDEDGRRRTRTGDGGRRTTDSRRRPFPALVPALLCPPMITVPSLPDLPADQRASAPLPFRYEDIAQDGRMMLGALSPALGAVIWGKLLAQHPAAKGMSRGGVVPILTRLVAEGMPGPFSVNTTASVTGAFQMAHALKDGSVDKIIVNMWAQLEAPHGSTFGPRPPEGAPLVIAGRVFAEHVLTRLFAPTADRKVTRLDLPGVDPIPAQAVPWRAPSAILALPDGAAAIEPDFSVDPQPVVFGVAHTDSNQHVNSLIYPRMFEESVVRRLAALGKSPAVLARFLEVGYRKPSFAGEELRIALRLFTLGSRVGAVGAFVTADEALLPLAQAKPRCCLKMLFEP